MSELEVGTGGLQGSPGPHSFTGDALQTGTGTVLFWVQVTERFPLAGRGRETCHHQTAFDFIYCLSSLKGVLCSVQTLLLLGVWKWC